MQADTFDVLIVDDDPIVVHSIESGLRPLCTCRVALDGDRALALMKRSVPDIVLLDVELPGCSGFDVVKAMRGDEQLTHVPTIMITSHTDEQFQRKALELGAVDFLAKPVSSPILLARVESHLRMSRAMWAMRQSSMSDRSDLEAALRALEVSHTKLAASVAKLDEANDRLRRSMHIASHDLREPVNTVAQFGELLFADFGDALPEQGRRYLRHVLTGATRMRTLLDNMVQYARFEGAAQDPMTRVSLNRVLDALLSTLAADIAHSGASVEVDLLPDVMGVEHLLSVLFQNLLSNALKFHAPGQPPVVRVRGERRGDQVEVHVQDQGIGIEQDAIARIHEPYFRLHRRAEFEGTGLGLSIAQQIAMQHESRIEVRSTSGQGSDFWLALRLA